VGEALRTLRQEVTPETAVLGFVGCPYTLATYLVEGKTSRDYMEIKKMAWTEPDLLHAMLKQLADNLGEYACYQIESGAQLIQIFDSWAGELALEIMIPLLHLTKKWSWIRSKRNILKFLLLSTLSTLVH